MKTPVFRDSSPRTIADGCEDCKQRNSCFLAQPLPDEAGDCSTIVRRHYSVPTGDFLFRRNMQFSDVYLVCDGAVKMQRETLDGTQLVTGFYLSGDVAGIEALGDTHYPCDAIAMADTRVCKLNFQRLLGLCSDKPGMQSWVISRVGLYARKKDVDLSWSMALNSHHRVLRFFLELYERLKASDAEQRGTASMPMMKQDIARYLHIAPETLSRSLAKLRKQNLLVIDQEHFTLPDLDRAQELTEL